MVNKIKECKVKIEGWNVKFRAIDRFVVRVDLPESSRRGCIGDFGFREKQISNVEGVYEIEDFKKLKGGLIIGSGDSGKTVLLEMLKSRLISNEIGCRLLKMRRFGRSVLKLKKALEKINSSAALYVLIDGLDEFPEGIDVLVSAIKSTKQKKDGGFLVDRFLT